MKKPLHINDDLLISYLLKEVSEEQAKQVEEWRALAMANERRFEQFKLIWDSSKNFTADPDIDAHASLQKVKQRAAEQKTQAIIIPVHGYFWLKIAAAILFIAGGSWLFMTTFMNPQVHFETQDIVKTDTLSDGSMITLNKYALLSYPKKFQGEQRNVALVKGEAFFSIAPNKAKPFIISTGGATIRVVGTSFNVKNRNGLIEVIVETGIVQVTNNFSHVMIVLKPHEMALVNPQTGKISKLKTPDKLYTYYRRHEFVAKGVPLYRLVQVLNEAYNCHIVIGRKQLANQQITATFNTDISLDYVLELLTKTLQVTIEKKQDQIILK
ncbi:FecR family protein [Mucilaginibacter sp. 22184]|uniref:FecR family protein n=1 Tax=Mucilaginibacter sp. 22184 TaxID=3453887 RepID=UPI003F86DB38